MKCDIFKKLPEAAFHDRRTESFLAAATFQNPKLMQSNIKVKYL